MPQEKAQKSSTSRDRENAGNETVAVTVAVKDEEAERLQEATEKLLDEIDELLEENPEEFVENYRQYGGE